MMFEVLWAIIGHFHMHSLTVSHAVPHVPLPHPLFQDLSPLARTVHCPPSLSPMLAWDPALLSPSSHIADQELFDLVTKLQSDRLDDQRCVMPGKDTSPWPPSRHRLESLLRSSPPYPMVSLPPEGGFWCDPSDQHNQHNSFDSDGNPVISDTQHLGPDLEETCRTYRAHFLQAEHFNFCGLDEVLGPVVVSVKYYCHSDSSTTNHTRVILRLTGGTSHQLVHCTSSSALHLARVLCPRLSLSHLLPVLCPAAAHSIHKFDR